MCWQQFNGYLDNIPEIRRIEQGKPLTAQESWERTLALAEKAERKRGAK